MPHTLVSSSDVVPAPSLPPARSRFAVVADKDGTLLEGEKPIPGAPEFVTWCKARGTLLIFSNTAKPSVQVAVRLTRSLGVEVREEEVLTAGDDMRRDLLSRWDPSHVRTVGLRQEGLTPLRGEDGTDSVPEDASSYCVAVFTDGDVPDFCATACLVARWILRGAAACITCGDDSLTTTVDGERVQVPGPGLFLAAVRACGAGEGAVRVYGKGGHSPSFRSEMWSRLAALGFGGSPSDVVFVGDRLDTDVREGRRAGGKGCLVLTGVHDQTHLRRFSRDAPSLVAEGVGDLAAYFDREEVTGWVHPAARRVRDLVCDTTKDLLRSGVNANRDWCSLRLSALSDALDAAMTTLLPPRRIGRRVQSSPELSRMG